MKYRPILFRQPHADEMVRAILEGRKTQTRRPVKLPLKDPMFGCEIAGCEINGLLKDGYSLGPLGTVGDRLWVITIKEIPGWEGLYGAGDDGEVYSLRNGKPKRLKSFQSGNYRRVALCKGGGQHMMTVHEAVCRAFYGAPSILNLRTATPEVRHLDGNSLNNVPENLDWGTPSQNWDDRKCSGRGIHEQHHNAKLSMSIAATMRASGKTAWALAKEYGVSPKTVRNVLRGLTWVNYGNSPANMPRWASRIDLEITRVWVERVQDITPEDCRSEGIQVARCSCEVCARGSSICTADAGVYVEAFRDLWQSIYGNRPKLPDNKDGKRYQRVKRWLDKNPQTDWDANPWVWAYEFRRVKP